MMTLTNEMKRFLTFLQLRFVKNVLKGFRITRYSSGEWNNGCDSIQIIRRSRQMRFWSYSVLKWFVASSTVMPDFQTRFSSMA